MRLLLPLLLATALAAAEPAALPASCIPAPRTDWAAPVAEGLAKRAAAQPGTELLFLGDSITQLWGPDQRWPNGHALWKERYQPRKALNLGLAGDRTEHLLWRITEGRNLDGLTPKVVVLLIGTNNLHREGRPDTPEETAAGVAAVLAAVRERLPASRVLLLGLFPRVLKECYYQGGRVDQVNARLAALADRRSVWYLDLGRTFLAPDGSNDRAILRDGLHLSEEGYRRWADAMEPYLADLLAGGDGAVWGGPGATPGR